MSTRRRAIDEAGRRVGATLSAEGYERVRDAIEELEDIALHDEAE